MKNTFKKLLAVLLSLLVCSAVLPAASLAAPPQFNIVTKVADGVSEYGYEMFHYEDSFGNTVESPLNTGIRRDITAGRARKAGSIPTSYNSFAQSNITPVRSQGNMGNCWAFTSAGVLESYAVTHMGAPLDSTDYSEAHLTWYANSVSQDSDDPMCGDGIGSSDPFNSGGSVERAALALAKGSGVALESDYPFNGTDSSQMGNYNDATARYEHNIGLLDRAVMLTGETEIKQAIIEYGALGGSYTHDDQYLNHDGVAYVDNQGNIVRYVCTVAAYYCDTVKSTNHAVMIVGWDDNYSKENFRSDCRPTSDGAWLCKNSWSQYWGHDGYFWISYEDKNIGEFYNLTMTTDYDYVSTYSGACSFSFFPLQTTRKSKVASVFVSQGDKTLEAAGFWICNDNVPYTVNVYKGISASATKPDSGTLAATVSGTFRQGYNTVKLPSSVLLADGEKYSIVAELTPVNGKLDVPIEGSFGVAQSGKSYVVLGQYSATTWYDCASNNYGNTFVYAYTNDIPQAVTAQSISINESSQSIYAGQNLQLTATVLPAETGNPAVSWSSSDGTVASVDASGMVTAMSAGTAVITASTTDGSGLSDSITITVLDNHFTISYMVDGSLYDIQTYQTGDNIVPPLSPQKTGYTFLYWSPSYPETMPPQNLTVSAVWQIKQFTVRTVVDSVVTSSAVYDYNTVVQEPAQPEKTGYIFNGWQDSSGNTVEFPYTVTQNADFIAAFSPKTDTAYSVEVYRMDFEGNYPETPESVEVRYATTDERVSVNYIVTEGFTVDRISTLSGIVSGDGSLVLKVYLNRRTYTVTAAANDGTQSYTYYFGQRVEPVSSSAPDGYIFAGWQPVLPATMPSHNVTVTPVYVRHISRPSISIINTNEHVLKAGESITLYASVTGADSSAVVWSVSGSSFTVAPSSDGAYCVVTALKDGRATVTAKLVSSAGEVLCSGSEALKCETGVQLIFARLLSKNAGNKYRTFISLFELIKILLFNIF